MEAIALPVDTSTIVMFGLMVALSFSKTLAERRRCRTSVRKFG